MKKFIALTLALIMSISCFSLMSFAEPEQSEHLTEVPEGYIGVYTIEDLYCVRNDLTANYILMNDIDLSEATAEGGDWNFGGRGWNPIGSNDVYGSSAFSGIFDGNNYSIKGMNININKKSLPSGTSGYIYIGLFSRVSGIIKNLKVFGDITVFSVSDYKDYYIGTISALVTSDGVIENCYSSITINSTIKGNSSAGSSHDDDQIGGITGFSYGTVKKCINNGKIRVIVGDYNRVYVGGICGRCDDNNNAVVSKCINVGSITYQGDLKKYDYSAGISGYKGKISNCYNVADISSTGKASGIVHDGSAEICYNIGNITSTDNYAIHNTYSTQNCYYLVVTGKDTTGATSLTDTQMKLKSMYQGWDFDNVWTMDGREDYPYPELRDVPLILPDDLKTAIDGTVTITGEEKVGSTLTAEVSGLVPADAELTYEWKADGVVVGTDSTYTITQEDVGKEITLTVKGNGDFKGEISSSAKVAECVHELGEYTNNNDATCTKNETKTAVCSKCNQSVTEEIENSKLPHSFTNYVSDNNATCTADGTKTAKCDNCDATDTIADVGSMKEHTYTSTTTDATCETDGETVYTCTECSDTYSETIEALGHDYSTEWTIDKAATCTAEGSKSHHCSRCDAKTDVTAIEKIAHSYTETVKQATCSEDGYRKHICKNCSDTYSEVISATGKHNDTNNDGKCDDCNKPISSETPNPEKCDCMCHRKGISAIFWKVVRVFYKIFRTNKTCACGIAHY
ncbi:MAG: hypothetical protein NC122_06150 [Faecalibacterium sp.]|nr:hypothetical protein [Ruminococcus sp.]MCM1392570.1 hypothetical protein [Ruminococcus sp.]MCM1485772.1 hypothetical protein [Faecalibacterium sp.]